MAGERYEMQLDLDALVNSVGGAVDTSLDAKAFRAYIQQVRQQTYDIIAWNSTSANTYGVPIDVSGLNMQPGENLQAIVLHHGALTATGTLNVTAQYYLSEGDYDAGTNVIAVTIFSNFVGNTPQFGTYAVPTLDQLFPFRNYQVVRTGHTSGSYYVGLHMLYNDYKGGV